MSNNVREETLEFADGSLYKGQVWDAKGQSSSKPHGYGKMVNNDAFVVEAYWQHGKVNGSGRLVAPNGDIFYGDWKQHKRFGRGIQFRAADRLYLVELYDDGKLTKRMRRAEQKKDRLHWRVEAADGGSDQPPALSGHTMTRVGAHLVLFGGVTHAADGKEVCAL